MFHTNATNKFYMGIGLTLLHHILLRLLIPRTHHLCSAAMFSYANVLRGRKSSREEDVCDQLDSTKTAESDAP